jgi:hypothetical protein
MDHALREHGTRSRRAALGVVLLDRGHKPAIGVVKERLKVGAADGLGDLARRLVGPRADVGEIDRPELPNEAVVGDFQAGLERPPGLVRFLRCPSSDLRPMRDIIAHEFCHGSREWLLLATGRPHKTSMSNGSTPLVRATSSRMAGNFF